MLNSLDLKNFIFSETESDSLSEISPVRKRQRFDEDFVDTNTRILLLDNLNREYRIEVVVNSVLRPTTKYSEITNKRRKQIKDFIVGGWVSVVHTVVED